MRATSVQGRSPGALWPRRPAWVLVHRYAGLFMALFLLVASLTGSILAFATQIDHALHPPRHVAPLPGGMLDALELRHLAEASVPGSMATTVPLDRKPGEAVAFGLTARTGAAGDKPRDLQADTVWLDPYTGRLVEQRKSNNSLWPVNRDNFLAIIVGLHYSLLLPGSWGTWLFGIAALLWTIDCFVSVYLTFPIAIRRDAGTPSSGGWWSRWSKAWQIKWRGSFYRVNFDLHRAGGLWPWLLLLVLAWTSVGFNLHDQVYLPVMRTVFEYNDPLNGRTASEDNDESPQLGWESALARGRELMAENSRTLGFEVLSEQYLVYLPTYSSYGLVVRSNRDLATAGGSTYVLYSGRDGRAEGVSIPRGYASGNTIETWMFSLHTASIGGWPYQALLCLVGFAIALLSVTGIYIWWRKRASRRWSSRRHASLGESGVPHE
jgi:uncharacterized iron-regulated membrane protein